MTKKPNQNLTIALEQYKRDNGYYTLSSKDKCTFMLEMLDKFLENENRINH